MSINRSARLPWLDDGKKLFVGPRFRRIRQQLGLSQTQIAEGLGISPSYINLIERNQRPVTAQILLRLAETYDLDLRDLATADEDRFFAELNEIFSDPLFRQIDAAEAGAARPRRTVPRRDPCAAAALRRLHRGAPRRDAWWRRRWPTATDGARFEANPIERVRDLIEANRNYFPELEAGGGKAARRDRTSRGAGSVRRARATRLREKHSIVTRASCRST